MSCKKILNTASKIGLVGLSVLLIGCSVSKKSAILSSQKRIKIFGGIEQKYSPKILKLEFEYLRKKGYSFLVTPYLGFSSDVYEGERILSKLYGLDLGIKFTKGNIYGKGNFGLSRLSRTFESNENGGKGHDFKNNFHTEFGIGYQGDGWHLGGFFGHRSVGNFLFHWDDDKQNSGMNGIGVELGTEF